jgi:hypothetical protein
MVEARIQHRSGINQAKIFYTSDTLSPYVQSTMAVLNEATNSWSGYIPAQPINTTIYYYIQGIAESGKTQVRPIVAPEGWWKFDVLDSNSVITGKAEILNDAFSRPAFPNPSKGITCIPVNSRISMTFSLDVYDASGRLVEHVANGKTYSGENRYYINTQNWSSGVYQVTFSSDLGVISQGIIVK